jgi:hypothetical protein
MGGIAMRNKNGVVLHLRGDSEEALLQLAPSGVTIKFREITLQQLEEGPVAKRSISFT